MTTMEDLTKTQIVLLTLLVSFITSIATGIITTSLLAQAPQGVTQTIDRVVERTIERVAPVPTPGAGGTVKEVTIVKEGDAIVAAIDNNTRAVVRIKSPAGADGVQNFYAMGVVVTKQGHILSDKRDVNLNGTYTVVFSDGSTLPATIVKMSDSGSFVLFKIQAEDAKLRALPTVSLSQSNPKLGQTVVALQGREKNAISVGRVLSLDSDTGSAITDIDITGEIPGSPLLNLSGELIGLKTSNTDLTLPASAYTVIGPLAKFVASNS